MQVSLLRRARGEGNRKMSKELTDLIIEYDGFVEKIKNSRIGGRTFESKTKLSGGECLGVAKVILFSISYYIHQTGDKSKHLKAPDGYYFLIEGKKNLAAIYCNVSKNAEDNLAPCNVIVSYVANEYSAQKIREFLNKKSDEAREKR